MARHIGKDRTPRRPPRHPSPAGEEEASAEDLLEDLQMSSAEGLDVAEEVALLFACLEWVVGQ